MGIRDHPRYLRKTENTLLLINKQRYADIMKSSLGEENGNGQENGNRKRPRTSMDTQQHIGAYIMNTGKLARFYNCKKKKRLDSVKKRAIHSEWDRVFDQLLEAIHGKRINLDENGNKLKHHDQILKASENPYQVLIGIGSSKVSGHAGPLIRHLISKFKGLGYTNIFLVDEYNTSQRCPKCKLVDDRIGQVSETRNRVKWYKNRYSFFHRDVMAGENIAHALR